MKRKKLNFGIFTGCRSDFGLVLPIIKALEEKPNVNVAVIVSGNHFSKKYGKTIEQVKKYCKPALLWRVFPEIWTPKSLAVSLGKLAIKAAEDLGALNLQALILTGDRVELLPLAQTAIVLGIPVVHVGGGETTFGAIDQHIRSCLTALATYHFVGTRKFAQNVIRLGANPKNIFVVGDTAIDSIIAQKPCSMQQMNKIFGFVPDRDTALVVYHSETLSEDLGISGCQALLEALLTFPGKIIITYPNSDIGSRQIIELINDFASKKTQVWVGPSLGTQIWATLLRRVGFLIGNSSSGIIEAPTFKLPAINIGNRQAGRFSARNVIHVPPDVNSIRQAITTALSAEFRNSLKSLKNPYGDGTAGKKLAQILVNIFNSKNN